MEAIADFFIKTYGFAGVVAIAVAFMWRDMKITIKDSMREISEPIKTLTTQLAVVVERVDAHEKRIDRLEDK